MTPLSGELGRITARGGPYDLGFALGRAGQSSVRRHLLGSVLWQRVTAEDLAPHVTRMADVTNARYPAIHQELSGLADGLGLTFPEVMAWNARGDLLALGGDGCTTVQLPGATPVLAHNEDGLPFFRGDCFLVDLIPEDGPRSVSFCYPGSIPGHTFAVADTGLVITVNNLRLRDVRADCPRMVLSRAAMLAPDRNAAIDLLRAAPVSGGFHLSMAQAGHADILSVSFGGGAVHVVAHTRPAAHANHALVLNGPLSDQDITASSRDRQNRADILLQQGYDPLSMLRDTGGEGLPIYRQSPDDPDFENTLAQFHARMEADHVDWQVWSGNPILTDGPQYKGRIRVEQSASQAASHHSSAARARAVRQEVRNAS